MTEKRFTYDNKQVAILKYGEFWLEGQIDTACNHSEICNELNNLVKENEQLKIKLIYNFIKNNIMPKYDVLCSCKVQDNEFYIEYDEFLSFDERNILNREILQQIYDFCVSSDIEEDCFFNISVFLVIKK
jgi:hypothetical protein